MEAERRGKARTLLRIVEDRTGQTRREMNGHQSRRKEGVKTGEGEMRFFGLGKKEPIGGGKKWPVADIEKTMPLRGEREESKDIQGRNKQRGGGGEIGGTSSAAKTMVGWLTREKTGGKKRSASNKKSRITRRRGCGMQGRLKRLPKEEREATSISQEPKKQKGRRWNVKKGRLYTYMPLKSVL